MKRYCQTLKLREDQELIKGYVNEHKNVWPEIKEGIKEVGILDMQIYICENILFMIVDTIDSFDWINDNKRLALLPRQAEWETYMSRFQQAEPGMSSNEKWQMMDKIFGLKD